MLAHAVEPARMLGFRYRAISIGSYPPYWYVPPLGKWICLLIFAWCSQKMLGMEKEMPHAFPSLIFECPNCPNTQDTISSQWFLNYTLHMYLSSSIFILKLIFNLNFPNVHFFGLLFSNRSPTVYVSLQLRVSLDCGSIPRWGNMPEWWFEENSPKNNISL